MILIPGLKGDGSATYASTVAHYKDHYKCHVITLPGFAGQPASKRDSDLSEGQHDELIEYVKKQHLHKPVLLSFSFGGRLALWMASTVRDLFSKPVDMPVFLSTLSVCGITTRISKRSLALREHQ